MSHPPKDPSPDPGDWFTMHFKPSPRFWAPKFNQVHMAAQEFQSTTSIAQGCSGCSDQLDMQPDAAMTPRC